jgi:1,4-dihydroxy-2-naphthoyl-CoA hydrolase
MSAPSDDETLEMIRASAVGTWAGEMGIHVVRASRDEVIAEIEIAPRHRQPYGIVHGGVHAGLIESVASLGAALDVMPRGKSVVGLENHTSFIRAVRAGALHAVGKPLTRGRKTQVWEVEVRDDAGQLAATGRVRLLVLDAGDEVGGEVVGVHR